MRHPIVLWSEENRNGLASSGAARRALVIALVDYPFTEDGHFHLDISDRIGGPGKWVAAENSHISSLTDL